MKIVMEGGKPRYEDDQGNPLPFAISGFSVDYLPGKGMEAAIILDLVQVRAMMRPRVCIVINGELAPLDSLTLKDGRTFSVDDLMQALER